MVVAKGLGEERGVASWWLIETVSVWEDEKVVEMDGDDGYTII